MWAIGTLSMLNMKYNLGFLKKNKRHWMNAQILGILEWRERQTESNNRPNIITAFAALFAVFRIFCILRFDGRNENEKKRENKSAITTATHSRIIMFERCLSLNNNWEHNIANMPVWLLSFHISPVDVLFELFESSAHSLVQFSSAVQPLALIHGMCAHEVPFYFVHISIYWAWKHTEQREPWG